METDGQMFFRCFALRTVIQTESVSLFKSIWGLELDACGGRSSYFIGGWGEHCNSLPTEIYQVTLGSLETFSPQEQHYDLGLSLGGFQRVGKQQKSNLGVCLCLMWKEGLLLQHNIFSFSICQILKLNFMKQKTVLQNCRINTSLFLMGYTLIVVGL